MCKCGTSQVCIKCASQDKNASFWDAVLNSNEVMYWSDSNTCVNLGVINVSTDCEFIRVS
jgi:hypothetical protein